ncbi:hypothetical protein TNCV_577961 [Trichonephila clavipes]|nr:hypothetical protein TNCV_577961 [Trichonephila clavipes]
MMNSDLANQLTKDITNCICFSLQFDESVDVFGISQPCTFIVRVHYFVRGGFVGYRSRASSKHLSSHLPVGSLDSSGSNRGCAGSEIARGRRIYKETDTRCCCCLRDVTLQLSPSLMELFR